MSSDYEYCLLNKKEHIWEITINRPDQLNALHPPANFELESIFNDFSNDKNAWIAILTGAGEKAFSTGYDLKFQASGKKFSQPDTGFAGLTKRFDLDKPVIAAVQGYAMGGGFEIALACDLIVADNSARFGLPEPKVGMAALAGGIHRLPQQIGQKKAMEILLTGRQVSAVEGLELGFINRLAEKGKVMEKARELAQEMLACSPVSLQLTKQMFREGQQKPDLETAITFRYNALNQLAQSKDYSEGPRAFAEKRKPKWSGE